MFPLSRNFSSTSGPSYIPLSAEPDSLPAQGLPSKPQIQSTLKNAVSVAIALLCLVLNIALLLASNSRTPLPQVEELSWDQIQSLRRPSQFIGMDQVFLNSHPTSHNITNYPSLIAQIDRNAVQKVFETDVMRQKTRIGTISPNTRRTRVTNSISTVFQFRIIDFGLNNCDLKLSFPPLDGFSTKGLDGNPSVEVWALTTNRAINPRQLNFANRPPRGNKVANIILKNNLTWTYSFPCTTDQVVTFEFACNGECDVEWWQDRDVSRAGVTITQSPST
ncbi:hypothetical protein BDN72DRAFT_848194 [Pluteus cervinus]|uniref:Uncharacterized protein n=1 Tax=Pluteus cervinus TaxID=181527 RepID=A0ACD3ABH6_9AGAR|nr:hypothetical protein BDN72DRAFT_848194 [Pluteus cervinus]